MSWFSDSIRAFLKKGDLLLLGLCLVASAFGLVLVYSATQWTHSNRYIMVQFAAICLGVLAYIAMSSVDFELFTEKSWKLLAAVEILGILALIPFGTAGDTINKSWIPLPVLRINAQPAEVVKLFFILLMAFQCAKLRENGISRPSSVFQLAGHTLIMCGLIAAISKDFGMVLTYLAIFIIMAWIAGVRLRWFALGGACAAAGIGAIVALSYASETFRNKFGYIFKRVTVVIDHLTGNEDTVWEQTLGQGMQQARSILAIGSGQLTGQGYLNGIQTQSSSSRSIFARHTDEIFAVCGEEFGLVGCVLLLVLLFAIILRCIWVARQAPSFQSRLIAMGFAGMLLVQVGVNVGLCLYVFPVVGLTLPFISYGGTSVLTMFAAMGVVSSVKMRSLPSWLRD